MVHKPSVNTLRSALVRGRSGEPRTGGLAGRDGARTRIRILRRCGGTDDIARDLLERLDGVELVDIDHYDLNLFNECAETGDLLISKPMWAGVHPQLVNVPVDWPRPVGMRYGLLYPADPEPQVKAFVARIGALAEAAHAS